MRILQLILLFVFSLISLNSHSVECEKDNIVVFFSNGMFNPVEDASSSAHALQSFISENVSAKHQYFLYEKVLLSRNENEVWYEQIEEVVAQKYSEKEPSIIDKIGISLRSFLWYIRWGVTLDFMKSYNIETDWYLNAYKDVASRYDENSYINEFSDNFDKDLSNHVDRYQYLLDAGYKVIIVPHSQGNFYANRAYDILQSGNLKVISVASPSYRAHGDYITLKDDLVIAGLVEMFTNVIDAQHKNSFSPNAGSGHRFIKNYLQGDVSSKVIAKYIESAVEELSGDCFEKPFKITSLTVPAAITIAPTSEERTSKLTVYWEGMPTSSAELTLTPTSCAIGWNCPTVNQTIYWPYSGTSSKELTWGCVAEPDGYSDNAPSTFHYVAQLTASNGTKTNQKAFNYTCVNPEPNPGTDDGSPTVLVGPSSVCVNDSCYCKNPSGNIYYSTGSGAITCCVTPQGAYIGLPYKTACSSLGYFN